MRPVAWFPTKKEIGILSYRNVPFVLVGGVLDCWGDAYAPLLFFGHV